MPNQTPNYNLVKPLQTENYDVDVFNGNADIIDSEFKKIEDSKKVVILEDRDLMNGWQNAYNTKVKFAKNGNIVSVEGAIINGATADGTIICNIPEGFFPNVTLTRFTRNSGANFNSSQRVSFKTSLSILGTSAVNDIFFNFTYEI